jgi:hypothetical protein
MMATIATKRGCRRGDADEENEADDEGGDDDGERLNLAVSLFTSDGVSLGGHVFYGFMILTIY